MVTWPISKHNKKLQSDSANCHAFFSKSPPACYAVDLGVSCQGK
jgi:hypothetical protein